MRIITSIMAGQTYIARLSRGNIDVYAIHGTLGCKWKEHLYRGRCRLSRCPDKDAVIVEHLPLSHLPPIAACMGIGSRHVMRRLADENLQ